MGKRSNKGKEKKQKRKEELEKKNTSLAAVQKANLVDEPLKTMAAFQKYTRNGLSLTLCCKNVSAMTEDELDVAVHLVKDNMETLYENSNWGWNEKDKRNEMSEENARYLLVKDSEENIVAMSHFRFDMDEDIEVLYCYEIQLLNTVRGKKLGKFMMQILELMAFNVRMKKVVLTVFKANERAIQFFTKMKYTVDETSPRFIDPLHPEEYDYEILSKILPIPSPAQETK